MTQLNVSQHYFRSALQRALPGASCHLQQRNDSGFETIQGGTTMQTKSAPLPF